MAPVSRDGTSEATSSRTPALRPSSAIPPPSPPSSPRRIPIPGTSISFSIPREFHSMTAGAGAGLVSSIVTCPLDVVKTRSQAQHLATTAKEYEGVRLTVIRIWRQAGFRGFYRGSGPTLGGYLPTWGIYFTVYDLVKDRSGDWSRSGMDGQSGRAESASLHVVAAMTAGATGTVMTNPLWVVKTRFMAQVVLPPSEAKYRNTLDAIRTIYRTEGFRAFYKGSLPSLMGVSHVAVQFPSYEKAKSWADQGGGDHSSSSPTTILACSAFSKMVASLITYPHEVLRTRIQIQRQHYPPVDAPSSSPSSSQSHKAAGPVTPTGSSSGPPRLFPGSHHTLYSPLVAGADPPPPPPSRAHPVSESHAGWWKGRKGGVIDTCIKIKRQDGWRGFYRGLSINLVRTVPNSAVTMLTYELIMRRLS